MSRRRKPNPLVRHSRRTIGACIGFIRAAAGQCRRTVVALLRRIRPAGPVVIIDARRRQAKHLGGRLRQAARAYARALGAELPYNLVVVVQRVVHEANQLNGLVQAFETPDGGQRHVILLALSVHGRAVGEEELLATLRCCLTRALEDVIGKPVRSVPVDLEVPRARAGAPIAEFRPNGHQPPGEPERGAIPIQRIENNPA